MLTVGSLLAQNGLADLAEDHPSARRSGAASASVCPVAPVARSVSADPYRAYLTTTDDPESGSEGARQRLAGPTPRPTRRASTGSRPNSKCCGTSRPPVPQICEQGGGCLMPH